MPSPSNDVGPWNDSIHAPLKMPLSVYPRVCSTAWFDFRANGLILKDPGAPVIQSQLLPSDGFGALDPLNLCKQIWRPLLEENISSHHGSEVQTLNHFVRECNHRLENEVEDESPWHMFVKRIVTLVFLIASFRLNLMFNADTWLVGNCQNSNAYFTTHSEIESRSLGKANIDGLQIFSGLYFSCMEAFLVENYENLLVPSEDEIVNLLWFA